MPQPTVRLKNNMVSFLDRFKKKPAPPVKDQASVKPGSEVKALVPARVEVTGSKRQVSAATTGVLLHPLVTEKITRLAKFQQAAFAVTVSANKVEVKKAVEAIYGVKPVRVQMIKVKGKTVRFGRSSGTRKDWKKAIVTLPAGASLESLKG